MTKVLSFHQFIGKTNEADLFGVTTSASGNLPLGYDDSDEYEPRDTRRINPSGHTLKLLATDHNEFAVLQDREGKKYIYYFDSSQPGFEKLYMIYNDYTNDYEPVDSLGVEAAANDVPKSAYGIGIKDWDNPAKEIIELDEELVDDLLDEFKVWVTRDSAKREVEDVLKSIAEEMSRSNESIEFSDEEDETEVMESEGIHPAIRQKLMDYLKDNPDATFPEAKKFISDKIAGWKLSQEDFEEAKKLM